MLGVKAVQQVLASIMPAATFRYIALSSASNRGRTLFGCHGLGSCVP
jgi:hypothetical protein